MQPIELGQQPANGVQPLADPVSMISIAELDRRPSRAPDHEAENRALLALAQELATSPEGILQKLAETALSLCKAHSAGLSLLQDHDQKRNFHWLAISGQWSPHLGGGTPRYFGPCGTVLDRNVPLLCSHPERDFPYFGEVTPLLEDALLIPFYIAGEPVGTIWVVSHDPRRRFDAEDLRVMTSLGTFASAAYQTWLSLRATRRSASIIESSNDAIVGKNLDGIITSWNPAAQQIFGYAPEEIIGNPVLVLIPEEHRDEERMILQRIRRGESVEHYETIRRRKDGSLIDVSLTVSPVKNARGEIVGASKIARDISDRKRDEKKMALLAREVDHRGKNLLAIIQATVQLTQAGTIEDFKTAVEGRIQALAKVHDVLAQQHWSGATLRHLISGQFAPYGVEEGARARLIGPDIVLNPNVAQAIGVVLHELATNAAKYGALSSPAGSVQVEWSRAANGNLVLHWMETGGPRVEPPKRRGFGTRLIEQTVRGQLNGAVDFDWHKDGMKCEITAQELAGGE